MTGCATCPLMTALLPLRYAIAPLAYEGPLLESLELPPLPDRFPVLERYTNLRERNMHYVPRLLRDGWLYVWIDLEGRLAEFQVSNGLLGETDQGGSVIDARRLAYLQVPAGDPVYLAWSPNRWSDRHFESLANDAGQRPLHMRKVIPGAAPHSQVLDETVFNGLPEVIAAPDFDWSGLTPVVPHWPNLARQTQRLEQRSVALVDDPWGITEDLAALVRLTHDNQELLRSRFGGEWGLAGIIRELSNGDQQLNQKLVELTDQGRLQQAWRESDTSQEQFETVMTGLLDAWIEWMGTLDCDDAPGTLASACESLDLAREDHRTILAEKFSISLLGPSYMSQGAAAIGRMMELDTSRSLWLWHALLGLREVVALGDLKKLVEITDLTAEALEGLPQATSAFATAINARLHWLSFHAPVPAHEALFTALSPVAAAELQRVPAQVSALGSGFLLAALARSGQQLAVEDVDRVQANQWLSEAANGKPARYTPVTDAPAQRLSLLRLQPANAAHFTRDNPYTWRDGALEKAPVRSLLVLVTGINLMLMGNEFIIEKRDVESGAKFGEAIAAVATAATSIQHKLAELNWKEGLSKELNPEAYSHGWGMWSSGLAAVTAAFDIIVFGLQAFESWRSGDYDTAALEVGLAGVSAGQLALGVQAFRAYREARAVALGLKAASAVRGLSRLGGWVTALSIGLTATLIGGLVIRFYIQNTPLERWLAKTRFGIKPADWAGEYRNEMERLYQVVFPVTLTLERYPSLNPRTGNHIQECLLLLELPGQPGLTRSMIHFEGHERRRVRTFSSLAWAEEEFRRWFTEEDRQNMQDSEFENFPVIWTGSDFDRHQGTHIEQPVGTAVYRRVHHDGDKLERIEGELTYQPQPGLEFPPIKVNLS